MYSGNRDSEKAPPNGASLDLRGLSFFETQPGIDAIAQCLLILLGNAEQHPDHPHRHLRAEVCDEVEAAASDEGVETSRAVGSHLRFDLCDPPWREQASQESTMRIVQRRILEENDPGRDL